MHCGCGNNDFSKQVFQYVSMGIRQLKSHLKLQLVMQPIMIASHLHGTIHTSKAQRHEAERTPVAANESFRTKGVRI